MSVLTPTDFCHAWAIFGPLVNKNTRKGELVELPASDTWGLSFNRTRSLPLKSFPDFFLNVLSYQLESWFIHWVGCTTNWVHVSLEWDPCDLLHVISLGTVNEQGIHWCWERAYWAVTDYSCCILHPQYAYNRVIYIYIYIYERKDLTQGRMLVSNIVQIFLCETTSYP